MKLSATWHPWKRWFENATAPPIKVTPPKRTIHDNVTPKQIQKARNWTRIP